MIDFLKTYWKVIVLLALLVLDLILVILNRRKPVKVFDSVHQTITSILPDLIKSAESSFLSGHGTDKLEMVKQLCYQLLTSVYGFSIQEAMKYEPYIVRQVEAILSTPQKKEEKR